MVLAIVLRQTHPGLGDLVTHLAVVLEVKVNLCVPPETPLVCACLATVGALIVARATIAPIQPRQHRFQQLREV